MELSAHVRGAQANKHQPPEGSNLTLTLFKACVLVNKNGKRKCCLISTVHLAKNRKKRKEIFQLMELWEGLERERRLCGTKGPCWRSSWLEIRSRKQAPRSRVLTLSRSAYHNAIELRYF